MRGWPLNQDNSGKKIFIFLTKGEAYGTVLYILYWSTGSVVYILDY